MWCPEHLNTQKSHPHTHGGALVPSRIIRPEIKKHSACQLPAAQWRSQQPTSAICVGVWEPLCALELLLHRCIPPTHTHARCWVKLVLEPVVRGSASACRGKANTIEPGVAQIQSRFLKMCQKVIMWCDKAAVNGGSRLSWNHHTAFTWTDRGDVKSARNEPK